MAVLALIVALGLAARWWQIERVPPGFYYDEAAYALDAQRVQAGARDLYFEGNNGREPLFIYVLAGAFSVWGPSPAVARSTAVVFGGLAIVALWAAARALFGPRLALIAAGLLAGSLWAIVLSRIALRATTLPFFECLFVAVAVYAWRRRQATAWPSSVFRLPSPLEVAAGVSLGLLAYTYLAARLIPVALAVTALVGLSWRKLTWADVGWGLRVTAVAALVSAPILAYALARPEVYFGRATQVGVDSAQALLDNVLAVAGMFVWRGDMNWRHNLAGRPVFDGLTAIVFVIGVGLAVWRVVRGRDGAWLLVLAVWGVLLIPTVLSDRAPHFLRAIGALPLTMCFPALAVSALSERLAARGRRGAIAGVAAAATVVGIHGGAGGWAYFGPYAAAPEVRFAFETAAVELAQAARACPVAWVDRRLLERYPSIPFLAPGGRPVEGEPLTLQVGCTFVPSGQSITAAVAALHGPVLIGAERAGIDRFDGSPSAESYPLYTQIWISPFRPPAEARAGFSNGVDLLAVETTSTRSTLTITTTWGAATPPARDWQSYVHVRDAQGAILEQVDGPLGGELLPASTWTPGNGIIMVARLAVSTPEPAGQIIAIGLYDLADGTRVPIRESGLEEVQLPLPDR